MTAGNSNMSVASFSPAGGLSRQSAARSADVAQLRARKDELERNVRLLRERH